MILSYSWKNINRIILIKLFNSEKLIYTRIKMYHLYDKIY